MSSGTVNAEQPSSELASRLVQLWLKFALAQTFDELTALVSTLGSTLFSADCVALNVVVSVDAALGRPNQRAADESVTHALPLSSGQRRHGALEIVHAKDAPAIDADLVVLADLAVVLASQIDRIEARLALEYEVTRRHLDTARLAQLHDLESSLSGTETVLEVVEVLSTRITSIVSVERVSFAQLGPKPGQSTIYGIVGMDAVGSGSTIPTNEQELEERFAQQPSYYNPDHRESEPPSVQAALHEMGIESSMNIGVFVRDCFVGTLNVGSREVDGFSLADQALLTTLSSFMGSTLERIDSHAQLTYEARHDSLTGLVTRQVFDGVLDRELESLRRSDDVGAVCFLDIDRFKMINDTAGHKTGDFVLQRAAARISDCLGPNDVLSRIGGDEFVMLLGGCDRAGYQEVCAQVVVTIDDTPFVADGRLVRCTVSVGLAFIGQETTSANDAVASADAACYVAKSHGGNRYSVASDLDDEQTSRKMAGPLLVMTQSAIERGNLQIYGQPIRAIGPEGISATEVLVRMMDDQGRMVAPHHFIPLAERYGLITKLDAWVVTEALALVSGAGRVEATDEATRLFINLSATSLSTDGFADRIAEIVTSSKVAPERICFEITETGTMQNFEGALRFLEVLKALGVEFALDDFGVGLSSLSHLRLLPVDYLKIDGSLIREIATNPLDSTMVESIKAMADAMGVKTIAEHIESQAAVDVLRTLGVQNAQGFFLGHPAPLRRTLNMSAHEISHHEAVATI